MIGAQSDSIGMDARGSEPMAGDESEGPIVRPLGGVHPPVLGWHDLLRI